MPIYANRGGNSSVVAFDFDPAALWIIVTFASGRHRNYEYEASKVGLGNVQRMIQLGQAGQGLGSFIQTNKTVKTGYSRRW